MAAARDLVSTPTGLVGLVLAIAAAPVHGDYDELPEGPPSEVARLCYSALAVPDVADWDAGERAAPFRAVRRRLDSTFELARNFKHEV